jgi:hypothetical protein
MSCTFSCLAAASGVPIPLRLIFLFSTAFNLCKLGDHIFFFQLCNHLPQTNTNVGEEIESNQDASPADDTPT